MTSFRIWLQSEAQFFLLVVSDVDWQYTAIVFLDCQESPFDRSRNHSYSDFIC